MTSFKEIFMRSLVQLLSFTILCLSFLSAGAEDDLAVIAQKTNNPVSDAWLLITQNDYTALNGDATKGNEYYNSLKFQPVLSVPVAGDDWNLIFRPVISLVSAPLDDDPDSTDPFGDRTNGLGDTVLLTLLGPNTLDGFIWGIGPTFIFPTASEDVLGQEKWQAGPAALWARLGNQSGGWGIEHFNLGFLAQQWWSYGGDSDRDSTSQADIQYFINWRQDATNLIGMTPNIRINWKESGSDRYSVPVGLGKIGLTKWGGKLIRWGVEAQYYVAQPDLVAPKWNLRFFIAPVIGNPFKAPKVASITSEFDRFAGRGGESGQYIGDDLRIGRKAN
jgi:hypothetical protein